MTYFEKMIARKLQTTHQKRSALFESNSGIGLEVFSNASVLLDNRPTKKFAGAHCYFVLWKASIHFVFRNFRRRTINIGLLSKINRAVVQGWFSLGYFAPKKIAVLAKHLSGRHCSFLKWDLGMNISTRTSLLHVNCENRTRA